MSTAFLWHNYGHSTIGARSAGTLSYSSGTGGEAISTNLNLPAPYSGSWIRNGLPLIPLVPVQ